MPSAMLRSEFDALARAVGYDPARRLLGVHIRRGDKKTNPYNRYHSGFEYVRETLQAARELGLCGASGASTSTGSERNLGCQLFVASDSAAAAREVEDALMELAPASGLTIEAIGIVGSATQGRSSVGVEVATAMDGSSLSLLMAHEVLFDIELLSRASVVVGTVASQVTRLACSLGQAHGTLSRAVALDIDLLSYLRGLFAQWSIRVDDVPWQRPSAHDCGG